MPIIFTYLGLCYAFEAVYHFYHPVPTLLDAITEDENQVVSEQDAQFVEEKKEEEIDHE